MADRSVQNRSFGCPVCLGVMRNAEVLPKCGHSFCASCIEALPAGFSANGSFEASCPMCRTPFELGSSVPNWTLREIQPDPVLGQAQQLPPDNPPAAEEPPDEPVELEAPHAGGDGGDVGTVASAAPAAINVGAENTSAAPAAVDVGADTSAAPAAVDVGTDTSAAPAAVDVGTALAACRRLAGSPALVALTSNFVKHNCGAFDEAEENKLEYTALHGQYVALVDSELGAGLRDQFGPRFDMATFLAAVPAYVNAHAAAGDDNDDEDVAAIPTTLAVLHRFTSFVHFKADMLEEKRRRRQSDDAMAKGAAILFAGRR